MRDVEFAVVDLETTGVWAEGTDRIVEIGVVVVDPSGNVRRRWETLLNPDRDLGPQEIHRIRAADVLRAPRFEDVAGHLVDLFRGRVLAAHNASFERRFLQAEFARAGVGVELKEAMLCTMQLAGRLLPVPSRSLAACCSACGIELHDAHRASADAEATAQLLARLLQEDPHRTLWRAPVQAATRLSWPSLTPANVALATRRNENEAVPHFLERVAARMPLHAGPAEETEYLALLDRCLLDRRLSEHEQDALVRLAGDLGIGRDQCVRLHQAYFDQLAGMAWADGVLSKSERAELHAVAQLLAIPAERLDAALRGRHDRNERSDMVERATGTFRLSPADRIVLTGATRKPREAWHAELEALGFVPSNGVSRKVKLVVAADPDSLSGKARKARELGIPVVDEAGLVALLAQAARKPRGA